MTVRAALLAALAAVAACASPPDTNACDPATIVSVPCSMGRLEGSDTWVIGGWVRDRMQYQAFTTYRICHGLGREPRRVEVWASFNPEGPLAQQIGNVAQVLPTCLADAGPKVNPQTVLLRNSGSQGFYVRIVIQ